MGKVVLDNLDHQFEFDYIIDNYFKYAIATMEELGLGHASSFNFDSLKRMYSMGANICPINYDGLNVGLLMWTVTPDLWNKNKVAFNVSAYVEPQYRGKNVLFGALNCIKRYVYSFEGANDFEFVFRFNVADGQKPIGRVVDHICEIEF